MEFELDTKDWRLNNALRHIRRICNKLRSIKSLLRSVRKFRNESKWKGDASLLKDHEGSIFIYMEEGKATPTPQYSQLFFRSDEEEVEAAALCKPHWHFHFPNWLVWLVFIIWAGHFRIRFCNRIGFLDIFNKRASGPFLITKKNLIQMNSKWLNPSFLLHIK